MRPVSMKFDASERIVVKVSVRTDQPSLEDVYFAIEGTDAVAPQAGGVPS